MIDARENDFEGTTFIFATCMSLKFYQIYKAFSSKLVN